MPLSSAQSRREEPYPPMSKISCCPTLLRARREKHITIPRRFQAGILEIEVLSEGGLIECRCAIRNKEKPTIRMSQESAGSQKSFVVDQLEANCFCGQKGAAGRSPN